MNRSARTTLAGLLVAGLLVPLAGATSAAEPGPVAGDHVAARTTEDPACTVIGTRRADRLVGTSGADVICGRGGNDVLIGARGDDVLRGGGGADRLQGGAGGDIEEGGGGPDRLAGGVGDDGLDGGPQADIIEGGPGTNWCTMDAADTAARCVYDLAAPSADQLSVSAAVVDVTEQDQSVILSVHVTDDTGADVVRVAPGADTPWFPSAPAALVSGTERDGWWEVNLVFRHGVRPGTFRPVLEMFDRVQHFVQLPFDQSAVEVLNANPDLDPPVVTLLSPGLDESFDAQTSDAMVTVRAQIADAGSGVYDQVSTCAWAPSPKGWQTLGSCADLHLESGDLRDGIWVGVVRIPEDSASGRWNLELRASDWASVGSREMESYYWGPDLFPFQSMQTHLGRQLPIPDGLGVVNVVGRSTGHLAPTVSEVQVSTDQVDTLSGPATVEMSFRAIDVDGDADGGYVRLVPGNEQGWPGYMAPYIQLVDGTVRNGVWRGTITLPQGLQPGVYYAEVSAIDRDMNQVILIASGHPYAQNWEHVLDNNPTVTVVDHTGA